MSKCLNCGTPCDGDCCSLSCVDALTVATIDKDVQAARAKGLPVCENYDDGECDSPLIAVKDYYANTPSPEPLWLCDCCTDRKCDRAEASANDDYYGGSTPTFRESISMVKPR